MVLHGRRLPDSFFLFCFTLILDPPPLLLLRFFPFPPLRFFFDAYLFPLVVFFSDWETVTLFSVDGACFFLPFCQGGRIATYVEDHKQIRFALLGPERLPVFSLSLTLPHFSSPPSFDHDFRFLSTYGHRQCVVSVCPRCFDFQPRRMLFHFFFSLGSSFIFLDSSLSSSSVLRLFSLAPWKFHSRFCDLTRSKPTNWSCAPLAFFSWRPFFFATLTYLPGHEHSTTNPFSPKFFAPAAACENFFSIGIDARREYSMPYDRSEAFSHAYLCLDLFLLSISYAIARRVSS